MNVHPCKVLLIDDDEDSPLITQDLLLQVSTAYELDWIDNFEAGLNALRQRQHDVCLLDYGLGAHDGLELLRRAVAEGCRTPIIMLTGHGDRAVDVQAMKAGAADYLVKDGLTAALLERVLRYTIERRKVSMGFRAAQEIQRRMLPQKAPVLAGFDIAGICRPAEATGGDFFDYVPMPNDSVGIVVADVSSHGFGPALIMAETRRVLRTLAAGSNELAAIVRLTNQAIVEDTSSDFFVTLFLGQLNPRTRTLNFVGAGHEGYLLNGSAKAEKLASTSLALGVTDEAEYLSAGPVHLRPGQLLVLLTDGLAEAMAANGQRFGVARALRIIQDHRDRSAAEILETLYDGVREFCQPAHQQDDITGVIVKVERP